MVGLHGFVVSSSTLGVYYDRDPESIVRIIVNSTVMYRFLSLISKELDLDPVANREEIVHGYPIFAYIMGDKMRYDKE